MQRGSRDEATTAANLLSKPSADRERVFVEWWQRTFDDLAPEAVVEPWVNDLHHELFDLLREHFGEHVRDLELPKVARLPCRSCGRIFESEPPRYARHCDECAHAKPYLPRATTHANEVAQPRWSDGVYLRGPYSPEAWWPVLCDHPDCLTLFSTTSRLARYCGSHTRASAQRARARDSTPKHTRFRFRLAREIDGEPLQRLTFTGREGRQIELVPGETYSARDELELAELASQLARGVVEVERCASA